MRRHNRTSIHLTTHHGGKIAFVFIIMSFLLLMVMVIMMIFINLYDFLEQPIVVVVRLVISGMPQRG